MRSVPRHVAAVLAVAAALIGGSSRASDKSVDKPGAKHNTRGAALDTTPSSRAFAPAGGAASIGAKDRVARPAHRRSLDVDAASAADGEDVLVDGGVAGTGNDLCSNAAAIAGLGAFAFDSSLMTTDGPEHAACYFQSEVQISRDEWFCWTAPAETCNGEFVVSTCGGTAVDTKIAVYSGCACPPTDAGLLTCGDDACGFQTRVSFIAQSGESILIRVGVFPGTQGGPGTFQISCLPPLPCNQSGGHCQARDLRRALPSNRVDYRVADDFTPLSSGSVSDVCFWGVYQTPPAGGNCQGAQPDSFEVRYFQGASGQPGPLIASFSQAGGTLTVSGPAPTGLRLTNGLPEYEYSATHAPVPVTAGQCYWVEVSNQMTGCAWYWEVAPPANDRAFFDGIHGGGPDGYDADESIVSDQSFCLNVELGDSLGCLPPPPSNDNCANAQALSSVGKVFFDNAGASQDGPSHAACLASGQSDIDHDLWYCWTSPCEGEVFVRTCNLTEVDTRIAVYDGCACPPSSAGLLACNDDLCGDLTGFQSMVRFNAQAGHSYMVRVGTYPGSSGGAARFEITCGPPDNPSCPGTTPCCVETPNSPGCNDERCCETVCACDPFCCDTEWDANCAGNGFQDSGCGAGSLCNCAATCGSPNSGDCCVGHTSPACSDLACCQLVCACDSWCCDVEWDEFCAGNGSIANCGAAILCQEACIVSCPPGPIEWVTPPDGTVDAGRPHLPDDANRLRGISTVVVHGPPGASAQCWAFCETGQAGTPNGIANMTEVNGTYTIVLNRPITPGKATTITYTDDLNASTTGTFISHPGNSNADATASAEDVIALAAALGGGPGLPFGPYSQDLDRSGAFAPLDIIEGIDLLVGSDAFAAWNNTPRPAAAPTCP